MPVLDPRILSELAARATELAAEMHTNVFVKRSVDHRVLETLAVGQFCPLWSLEEMCLCYKAWLTTSSSRHVYFRRWRIHVLGNKSPKQIEALAAG